MKRSFLVFSMALCLAVALMGCGNKGNQAAAQVNTVDTVAQPEPEEVAPVVLPELDPVLNASARILAGLPVAETDPGYAFTQTDAWKSHAAKLDKMWANSKVTLDKAEAIRVNDLTDLTGKAKTVFYSFSGPDFPFMATFFPNAETYYMMALEPAGSPITPESITAKTCSKLEKAVGDLLRVSYFMTNSMASDLNNVEIDGAVPILMVLIARMGYQISAIEFQDLTAQGEWVASEKQSPFACIRYFREGEAQEHTLYYLSTNIANAQFDPRFQANIDKLDPATTASFIKSASYRLHHEHFSQMRNDLLNHSYLIIQDDTGVPYDILLAQGWDVMLYGAYTDPVKIFDREYSYQKSLRDAYAKGENIRPLGFQFGYNRDKCSLMVCVKK
ncbi:MAG: hypothetical protein J6X40_07410 [Bacteroidales bacterium]|nr:hypothetical protein [Bacteroidales bacterium]